MDFTTTALTSKETLERIIEKKNILCHMMSLSISMPRLITGGGDDDGKVV
jgi:hypothetical protein